MACRRVLRTPLEQPLFVLGVALHPRRLLRARRARPRHRPRSAVRARPDRSASRDVQEECSDEASRGRSSGDGEPLLLIHGLGYDRWGWGPSCRRCSPSGFRVLLVRQPRDRRVRQAGGAVHRRADGRRRARRCSTKPASSARTSLGVSLGGMIAQELALAAPGAGRQARALLHDARRPEHGARCPTRTLQLFAEAPTLAPEVALRRFVENALGARSRRPELVEEIFAVRASRTRPTRPGWQAQAAAGADLRRDGRSREIAAPTLDPHRHRRQRRRPRATRTCSHERIPGARVELLSGLPATSSSGSSPTQFVSDRRRSSSR